MILGFDIGNTHIVSGIFDSKGEVLLSFRVSSNENLTEDEFFSYLKNITEFNKVKLEHIEGIIISSVVPNLTNILYYLSKKYFSIEPLIISSKLKLPISFDIDNPNELGADRLCNVVEAVKRYPNDDLIIIDFGTATTFDIMQNNTYIGGYILPGINLSIKALFSNTAKLPNVRFEKPDFLIGKNTMDQINSGIYYGSIGQIEYFIKLILQELKNAKVICTGGLAEIFTKEISAIDEYLSSLTLKGLYTIYQYNKE